ncbi:MAG: flagellar hook-associated protein FlgK [Planctomycetes bacterium]|nr:flagellar hook-associated protein FlgK [Planctomycetota bacterium]
MADSLLIGLSALQAHKRAMDVTSHNIANAATPGYTRQTVALSTPTPELIRPGTIGRGVRVDSIDRNYDALITERLRESETEIARLDTLGKGLEDLELVYNEPGSGGLSNVINNLFSTLQDLSNNPESTALRTGLVQNFETFSSTLNVLYERVEDQRDNLVIQGNAEVNEVNNIISEIASLNVQISREVLVSNNPNDMEDQRDRLIRDLARHIEVREIRDPNTGSVRLDVNGRALVSSINYFPLAIGTGSNGELLVRYADSGDRLDPVGGSLAALENLSGNLIPDVLANLDGLASSLIAEFNAINATGISHSFSVGTHTADRLIDANLTAVNLDDARLAENVNDDFGIPTAFTPDFTDANGNVIARNLTINLYNESTGVAEKFTVMYEPGGTALAASRSLDDLVSAINTGRGGGFSVYPPRAGGIDGVEARSVAVTNCVRLQLVANSGFSIDFSPALDTRPTNNAWTGGQVSVSAGAPVAALVNTRLVFEVANGGTDLSLYSLDPITGNQIPYPAAAPANEALINPGGATAIGGLNLAFAATGTYADGDSFSVDFDNTGAVIQSGSIVGASTVDHQWTAANAGFQIKGRYTGGHSFDDSRQWEMSVVSGGTVGSSVNAPVVQVAFYTGPDDARVQEIKLVTLDDNLRAGEQVEIAEGVYVIFDDGVLTTGDVVNMSIDGQPDQAGLLTALGINGVFSGSSASDMRVRDELKASPAHLAVASTRAAGDNSNLLRMIEVRDADVFGAQNTKLDDYYQSQVSSIAVQVQQTEVLIENQSLVMGSLENRRDEVSGVSLDEEVGLLILQQQAYSAAARLITMARENIDTLMGILN